VLERLDFILLHFRSILYTDPRARMSRLKPAFGAIAPAAGRMQQTSKQQQAFEQDDGIVLEKAHLTSRECVDASLQVYL
jgi:hypothetical protein